MQWQHANGKVGSQTNGGLRLRLEFIRQPDKRRETRGKKSEKKEGYLE